ncbi:phage holin [Tolumonas lignilytica]|uniref:phage holin n=1 Tax=Tolumonas lignilytica TaxID=1283284 RepID=UPI000686CC98|nr:phage holin [Tolumonas lignilytica]
MPERITTTAAYGVSGFLATSWVWLKSVNWNEVAVILGIILGLVTYFTNLYFQRRQTKAIEQAAKYGVLIKSKNSTPQRQEAYRDE